uniref:Wsv343-like protein n=1 Tax=Sicyonia whispovirus TaxID=2984283 RepID=A0A9C7CEH2_9VIRU|nr:MAG: wsv343-like protein [Sicyonia whispovirus]
MLPAAGRGGMFTTDVLDMAGGAYPRQDVRGLLVECAEKMAAAPERLRLRLSEPLENYDSRRIPLVCPNPLPGEPHEPEFFSTHSALHRGSPLPQRLGTLTAKDMNGDRTYNRSNLLYCGSNVVEYDLVETAAGGRQVLYCEPPLLGEMAREGAMSSAAEPLMCGDDFSDGLKLLLFNKARRAAAHQGPRIGSGKLLREIMVLAGAYEEQTRMAEAACMAPALRTILTDQLDWDGRPMFRVAFLTNAALMGFKAVFYPTALERNCVEGRGMARDCLKTKSLLKMQLLLLGKCMPTIVERVEAVKRKMRVVCFMLDAGGSSNWNLPGHAKNKPEAMPYHRARLIRSAKADADDDAATTDTDTNADWDPRCATDGVLEITNCDIVTSLGVVPSNQLRDWVCHDMQQLFVRSLHTEKFVGAVSAFPDDWRRRILFSELGPEMPFRNKSTVMDLDLCLAGMCYNYLASGNGLMLTRVAEPECKRGQDYTFAGLKAPSAASDGELSWDSDQDRRESPFSGERRGSGPLAANRCHAVPQTPSFFSREAIVAYESLLAINKVFTLMGMSDNLGFFLGERDCATKLAMGIIMASSPALKKDSVAKVLPNRRRRIATLLDIPEKEITHEKYVAVAAMQLIVRYEVKELDLPAQMGVLCQRLSGQTWSAVNFPRVWKFSHLESLYPPTERGVSTAVVSALEEQTCTEEEGGQQGQPDAGGTSSGNHAVVATINKLLSLTTSTFATGADKRDTMFSWLMVVMAERFCAVYNAVSNPAEFYEQMVQEERLEFRGGFGQFEAMCSSLLDSLDIYVPESETPLRVCREGVRGYEARVERCKNVTNAKVCKVKMEEFKMVHGLGDHRESASFDFEEGDVGALYECAHDRAFDSLFNTLPCERGRASEFDQSPLALHTSHRSNQLVTDKDDAFEASMSSLPAADTDTDAASAPNGDSNSESDSNLVKQKQRDFFRDVNMVRSQEYRLALAHRQQYTSVNIVREAHSILSHLVVLPRERTRGPRGETADARTIREAAVRNRRMRRWVVPFTMPAANVKAHDADDIAGGVCLCYSRNAGGGGDSPSGASGGCVKLLVLPSTEHLQDLAVAMRFNTLAHERRYFGDASAPLGFTTAAAPKAGGDGTVAASERWDSIASFKANGDFLGATPEPGVYRKIVCGDDALAHAFEARTLARKRAAEEQHVKGKEIGAFFTGVWGLCAGSDLETLVAGSTTVSPSKPTGVFAEDEVDRAARERREAVAVEAIKNFHRPGDGFSPRGFYECFLDMEECVARSAWGEAARAGDDDVDFFAGLVNKYGPGNIQCARLWALLECARECFLNSLPLDWQGLATDWFGGVLNLKAGAPKVDESGVVFELAKFLYSCARALFGNSMDASLAPDVWSELLDESGGRGWKGDLARAYEMSTADNDVRSAENFIEASRFLTNNDVCQMLRIKKTADERVKLQDWVKDDFYPRSKASLEARARWMSTTEATQGGMTFSTVLASVLLFRLFVLGDSVRKLADPWSEASSFDGRAVIPLLVSLKKASESCPPGCGPSRLRAALESLHEARFSDMRNDPLYFYRFTAYSLGVLVNNDMTLEGISRRILLSFDFNGFDTSNWLRFVYHFFGQVVLGRRARLLSRPLSLIKNLSSTAGDARNFEHPPGMDSEGLADFEDRVCRVAARVARLVLVKKADSEVISTNDILDCFVLEDGDITAGSVYEFLYKTRRDLPGASVDTNFSLASNSCTSSQLARLNKASRVLDTNISFLVSPNSTATSLEDNDEGTIDLSSDANADKGSIFDEDPQAPEGRGGRPLKRTASRRRRTAGPEVGTSLGVGGGGSNPGFAPEAGDSCSLDFAARFDEGVLGKSGESRDEGTHALNDKIARKLRTMLTQNQIKTSITEKVESIKRNLLVGALLSEDDHDKYGVTAEAMRGGALALERWNAAVKREAAVVERDCSTVQDRWTTYDMGVVNPADFDINYGARFSVNGLGAGGVFGSGSVGDVFGGGSATAKSHPVLREAESGVAFWFDFSSGTVSNKSDPLSHQGRKRGHPLKVFVRCKTEGIFETRTLAMQISNRVCDSYWERVMPTYSTPEPPDAAGRWAPGRSRSSPKEGGVYSQGENSEQGGFDVGGGGNRGETGQPEGFDAAVTAAAATTIAPAFQQKGSRNRSRSQGRRNQGKKIQGQDQGQGRGPGQGRRAVACGGGHMGSAPNTAMEIVRVNTKRMPMNHLTSLLSMYTVSPDSEDLKSENTNLSDENSDVFVNLGSETGRANNFKALRSLWYCNNGVSPREQVHLLKKLVFKNLNALWVRQYERHISVLAGWGCASLQNIKAEHFHLAASTSFRGVVDANPPLSPHHSRFLDGRECLAMVEKLVPLVTARKIIQQGRGNASGQQLDAEPLRLARALYCREVLSSCFDPRGEFYPSWMTNSLTVLFTPGTSTDASREIVAENPSPCPDTVLEGESMTKVTRCFVAMEMEVTEALKSSLPPDFSDAGCNGGGGASDRVLRPTREDGGVAAVQGRGCCLGDSAQANRLMLAQQSALNGTEEDEISSSSRKNSLWHLLGMARGFALNPRLVGLTKQPPPSRDMRFFRACHASLASLGQQHPAARILFTDWATVKSAGMADAPSACAPRPSLAALTGYNAEDVSATNQRSELHSCCCFLANPVCPSSRMLTRAPNMRMCITNAGVALLSRMMAQNDRGRKVASHILDNTAASFRKTSTCASVDNNRYFLIDGSYLLGGRLENFNLVTDLFVRNKLKAEKHVILSSLFSPHLVSAALSMAVEGTTLAQGLALVEHVSYMKNTEASVLSDKNYWSLHPDDGEDGPRRCHLAAADRRSILNPPTISGGGLTPPSVFMNDENYIFLKILYEISVGSCASAEGMGADPTSLAAKHAMRKCYISCVDQHTGMPRMDVVHLLRGLMNFGGLCTAIASGDAEKSHHMIQTLNSISLNLATKLGVVFVGTTGNNLKTTLVDLCKKAWFERYADINITALNTSGDSISSSQANIATFAGKKSILIADEVGYQGTPPAQRSFRASASRGFTNPAPGSCSPYRRGEAADLIAKINEAQHAYGSTSAGGGTGAVWAQIDKIMTETKLKVCATECARAMRDRVEPAGCTPLPFGSDAGPGDRAEDEPTPKTTGMRLQMSAPAVALEPLSARDKFAALRGSIHVKAFCPSVMWWNCVNNVQTLSMNETRTLASQLARKVCPFSVTRCADSPWLDSTDAVFRFCSKSPEERGKYERFDLEAALGCLLGDRGMVLLDAKDPEKASPLESLICPPGAASRCAEDAPAAEAARAWRKEILHFPKHRSRDYRYGDAFSFPATPAALGGPKTSLAEKTEKAYNDLVLGDDLLRWAVVERKGTRGHTYSVLSCMPSTAEFAEAMANAASEHRQPVPRFRAVEDDPFKKLSSGENAGALVLLHARYPCQKNVSDKLRRPDCAQPAYKRPRPAAGAEGGERGAAAFFGCTLNRVSPWNLESLRQRPEKLSSLIFSSGAGCPEEDEDEATSLSRDAGQEYDKFLFQVMTNPRSEGYPRITTDGSAAMQTSLAACSNVMAFIRNAVETGRTSNTGTFVKLCASLNLLDGLNSLADSAPRGGRVLGGSFFGDVPPSILNPLSAPASGHVASPFEVASDNRGTVPFNLKSAKRREMAYALMRYENSGFGNSIGEVAEAMAPTDGKAPESAITKHMLPGQFSSNLFKKSMTKGMSVSLRNVYDRPSQCSFTMTPIMMSNSHVFVFFVDEAMSKRLITFSCETRFLFKNKNEDVRIFTELLEGGLRAVHSALMLDRTRRLEGATSPGAEKRALEYIRWTAAMRKAMAAAGLLAGSSDDKGDAGKQPNSLSDTGSVAALLPSKALQHLVKHQVLEHKDAVSVARLEENTNTFMHLYSSFTLSSKTGTNANAHVDAEADADAGVPTAGRPRAIPKKREIGADGLSGAVCGHSSHPLQMCRINPKSLNTVAMDIARTRQAAWAKLNVALGCVLFVDAPFVETSALYGEDYLLKMRAPAVEAERPALDVDWVVGLRVPNEDVGVAGYNAEGVMMGAGTAIMRQVCDAWGSVDIRSVMYSCHHLHMLFELVLQVSNPKYRLSSVRQINSKDCGVDFVTLVLTTIIYKQMINPKYHVFLEEAASGTGTQGTPQDEPSNDSEEEDHEAVEARAWGEDPDSAEGRDRVKRGAPRRSPHRRPKPLEIQIFQAMIINRPLRALRNNYNLGRHIDESDPAMETAHSEIIKYVCSRQGLAMNPDYLCRSCRTHCSFAS